MFWARYGLGGAMTDTASAGTNGMTRNRGIDVENRAHGRIVYRPGGPRPHACSVPMGGLEVYKQLGVVWQCGTCNATWELVRDITRPLRGAWVRESEASKARREALRRDVKLGGPDIELPTAHTTDCLCVKCCVDSR